MTPAQRPEVVHQGLVAVAEEMGTVLARAAFSPNIKERLDHSCAVFTPEAEPVAQAEHIPVHLGAMPLAVEAVLSELGELGPDDVALVNDPYTGGTHLPDLTMVQAVHHEDRVIGYLAARAHHADVGGISPGSMPATSTRLGEEGLVIPPRRIVEAGTWRPEAVEDLMSATRDPHERRGDLRAQHGALVTGRTRLQELAQRYGVHGLTEAMDQVLEHAHELTLARLADAQAGTYEAAAQLRHPSLPGGSCTLAVTAQLSEDGLSLDYTGTSPQVEANLNAPHPVTLAGALYVIRLLVGHGIPTGAGMARALEVSIPDGTLLNPAPGAAVAAGNVETSQRNVDLLLEALQPAFPERVPAASQGTMNNLTMGGQRADGSPFTYYETTGGGEGATPHRPGASGIHTHMTNTRNTPIEALEHAYPLRVTAQTLRDASGGHGQHAGGQGIRRAVQALVDGIEANLITTRRASRPPGQAGGQPGAPGVNRVVRADGTHETLAGIAQLTLSAGDTLILETPGGGGWGSP